MIILTVFIGTLILLILRWVTVRITEVVPKKFAIDSCFCDHNCTASSRTSIRMLPLFICLIPTMLSLIIFWLTPLLIFLVTSGKYIAIPKFHLTQLMVSLRNFPFNSPSKYYFYLFTTSLFFIKFLLSSFCTYQTFFKSLDYFS